MKMDLQTYRTDAEWLAEDLEAAAACLRDCRQAGPDAAERWLVQVNRLRRRCDHLAPAVGMRLCAVLAAWREDDESAWAAPDHVLVWAAEYLRFPQARAS